MQKGYVEEVSDTNGIDGAVWYLSHHPVLNPHKPGKLCIVYDCAARYQGISLNDCIHQGPDLTNKLLGVLFKFRQEPAALNADIEGMFHQVRVPPEQRDVLCFLWWQDDNQHKPPKKYRMTAHLFGGVWILSAAGFALQRVAEDNQGPYTDVAVQTVKSHFYVDDCLKSVATEKEAIALTSELRQLLASGGFRLTKGLSNSKPVMKSIPVGEWAKSMSELDLKHDKIPNERTLGMLWDVEQDCFTPLRQGS